MARSGDWSTRFLVIALFTSLLFIWQQLSTRTASSEHHPLKRALYEEPVNLTKRVTDTAWTDSINKGCRLLSLCGMSIEDATTFLQKETPKGDIQSSQTQWTDFASLLTWGWEWKDKTSKLDFGEDPALKTALTGLGVSLGIAKSDVDPDAEFDHDGPGDTSDGTGGAGGPNVYLTWKHDADSTHKNDKGPSVVYPNTQAVYKNVYNTVDGVIMATENYGPIDRANWLKRNGYWEPADAPVTLLRQWSDVVGLEWLHRHAAAGSSPEKLKYIFRVSIRNAGTSDMIKHALLNSEKVLSKWPGVKFSMSSDEGRALLGTANGGGVAWLLVNHKGALGRRTIDSVTVFRDDSESKDGTKEDSYYPSLLFTIVEWKEDGSGATDPTDVQPQ